MPHRKARKIDKTCSKHFNWRAGVKEPTDERQLEPAEEPSAAARAGGGAERGNKKRRPMRTLTGASPLRVCKGERAYKTKRKAARYQRHERP